MWLNFDAENLGNPFIYTRNFIFVILGFPHVFCGKRCGPKTAATQHHRCILPQGALNFCSFSPTDVKAITAARDGTVKVWEFEEGIEGGELELRTESGNCTKQKQCEKWEDDHTPPPKTNGRIPKMDGFGKGGTPALNMEIFGMLNLWGVNVSGQGEL